jgi:IrrE N-terminal-like domain
MVDNATDHHLQHHDLFETERVRSLLDQLLEDSRLYIRSEDFKALLDFVVKLRNFAPFNAMLLQVQKPGLSYAASARDWHDRFGRRPKEGARPLVILWPFGPVALVYDVMDTEGETLPEDVKIFFSHGAIDETRLKSFAVAITKKNIEWYPVDVGDQRAGSIRVIRRARTEKEATLYRMQMNQNHLPAVQFTTLTHELGHLCLGHLGPDKKLNVPERSRLDHTQQELEAESVAYLVCERNGVTAKSKTYLSTYVKENTTIEHIDLYQVMRAAGQVETLLGLAAHMKLRQTPAQGSLGFAALP